MADQLVTVGRKLCRSTFQPIQPQTGNKAVDDIVRRVQDEISRALAEMASCLGRPQEIAVPASTGVFGPGGVGPGGSRGPRGFPFPGEDGEDGDDGNPGPPGRDQLSVISVPFVYRNTTGPLTSVGDPPTFFLQPATLDANFLEEIANGFTQPGFTVPLPVKSISVTSLNSVGDSTKTIKWVLWKNYDVSVGSPPAGHNVQIASGTFMPSLGVSRIVWEPVAPSEAVGIGDSIHFAISYLEGAAAFEGDFLVTLNATNGTGGIAGPKGDKGDAGAGGGQGPPGIDAAGSDDWPLVIPGPPGAPGAGIQGIPGPPGADAEPGIAEFIPPTKGDQGVPGNDGAAGIPGIPGIGIPGADGLDGAPGEFIPPPSAAGGITQLTSDVAAGPGSGSQAATIQPAVVTYSKIQNVTANRLLGRGPASSGSVQEISLDTTLAIAGTTLGLSGPVGITQLTGDVAAGPGVGSQVATIQPNAVTYAKMQNVTSASRLLGRGSAGTGGVVQQIDIDASLGLIGGSGLTLHVAPQFTMIFGGTSGIGAGFPHFLGIYEYSTSAFGPYGIPCPTASAGQNWAINLYTNTLAGSGLLTFDVYVNGSLAAGSSLASYAVSTIGVTYGVGTNLALNAGDIITVRMSGAGYSAGGYGVWVTMWAGGLS